MASATSATTTTSKPTPESAFYDNLTLGLLRLLSSTPRITQVQLDKRAPCERAHVSTWEQRHNVYLPDDMKRFYLSTDGFTLHWSYQYSPDDVLRVGFFSFPPLGQITLLRESIETFLPPAAGGHSSQPAARPPPPPSGTTSSCPAPQLTSRSKIFELSSIGDLAKVCLIYELPECNVPRIYLLELAGLRWQFLADTFTEYHRMAIVHLGLPYWELCFASCSPLPPWTEQLFLLLAPHLLEKGEQRRCRSAMPTQPVPPYQQLDGSLFRVAKTGKMAEAGGSAAAGGGGGGAGVSGAGNGRGGGHLQRTTFGRGQY